MADSAAGIIPRAPPLPQLIQQTNLERTDSTIVKNVQECAKITMNDIASGPKKPSDVVKIVKPFESTKNNLINRDIISFRDLLTKLETTFWAYKTRNSSSLDLIAIYLKGQKILYIESKVHCENNLNSLMIPAICVSAACTVLSTSLGDTDVSKYVISGLTAFNSFILAMISYLKLDAKAEAHRVSAYKFDKLQTKCEFFSGKIMHSPESVIHSEEEMGKKIDQFIDNLENNIVEIKEINQFIIPQTIRYRYPNLYSTNIFSEIKKKRNIWKIKINELNAVYNKITEASIKNKEAEIKDLIDKKEKIIFETIHFNNEILCLDNILTKEIDRYIEYKRKHRWYHSVLHFFGFKKSYMKNEMDFSNKRIQTDNVIVSADIIT